jgi:hypothetical protein
MAVPYIKRSVDRLSPRRLGFDLRAVPVGFAVGKVALGQVFLGVLLFPLSVSF